MTMHYCATSWHVFGTCRLKIRPEQRNDSNKNEIQRVVTNSHAGELLG